jgi:type IV pilus assembly protein PilW
MPEEFFMRRTQRGFSLVEIMVGLVIGMLAMLVVLQFFSNAEARKRTTTSGADAQTGGAVALYMLERDTKMAGWGMETTNFAQCEKLYTYCDDASKCGVNGGPLNDLTFAPVLISNGANGGPDSITVQYFSDPDTSNFKLPSSARLRGTMPQSSAVLEVNTTNGCREGDLMVVSQAGSCTLMNITHVLDTALKLQHNPGASGYYNPDAGYQKKNNWPAYTKGARVACFKAAANGPVFKREYEINATKRQLERSDNTKTPVVVNEQVMADIIDLQAQYGVAEEGMQEVGDDDWVDATGDWAKSTPAVWRRIKSVRIAIVARSSQYERPAPGKTCGTTTAADVAQWSGWAKFNSAAYPSNWSCYRYKVFETVIPLRNVIWGNL